jgi:hypothetical protein
LLKSWLQKKLGLKSSQKDSVKCDTLSQRSLIWHSGYVTTAAYRILERACRFRLAEKACSVRRLCLESPDKFLAGTGRLGEASVPQFKQNN